MLTVLEKASREISSVQTGCGIGAAPVPLMLTYCMVRSSAEVNHGRAGGKSCGSCSWTQQELSPVRWTPGLEAGD